VDQPVYTNVDVLLQPASLEPLYFNVHHENRPFGSFLVVAYKAYAPFTVITSAEVTGDELSTPVDITGRYDEWHEYWYMIPESEFDHGSIPSGVHTYELYVTAVGDEWSGTDSPNIQPLDVPTLITPGDGDILGDTATFRWNAIAGAVRYRVELYEVGGSWTGGNVGYRVYSAYTADTTFTLIYLQAYRFRCCRWQLLQPLRKRVSSNSGTAAQPHTAGTLICLYQRDERGPARR
jgi:hypothetical protein